MSISSSWLHAGCILGKFSVLKLCKKYLLYTKYNYALGSDNYIYINYKSVHDGMCKSCEDLLVHCRTLVPVTSVH